MNDLLLNKLTSAEIEKFLTSPAHALIVEGKKGAGKGTLATHIAAKLLNQPAQSLDYYPYFMKISPDGQSVTIDSIREVQNFLKLKTTGQSDVRRILTIEQAEKMTTEAQNALLKVLEEPPDDTVVLIITANKLKLLPTLRSRTQILSLKSITKQQIENYFKNQGYELDIITSAYYAGNAQIGLIATLLADEHDNPGLQQMATVKKILAMNTFDRLVFADELIKQKTNIDIFIETLNIVCQAALKQTIAKENYQAAKRWQNSLKLSLQSQNLLSSNPNQKLLISDLLINL